MGKILVAEEKHGTFYYPASTTDELAKSALGILTNRFNAGHWYYPADELFNDDSKYEKNILSKIVPGWAQAFYIDDDKDLAMKLIKDYRENVINTVPDEDARVMMGNKLNKAIKREQQKIKAQKEYENIRSIVEKQDLSTVTVGKGKWERQEPVAWLALDARSDYEYERVVLENLEEV